MYNFLNSLIMGKTGFAIEIVICEILFSSSAKARKYPYITIPAAIAVQLVFGYFVPVINAKNFSAIVTTLVIFCVSVFVQYVVLDLSFKRILFNSVAAYATQGLALNLGEALLILTGWEKWLALVTRFITDAGVYSAVFFLIARKGKGEIHTSYVTVIFIAFFTTLITNVMFSVFAINAHAYIETKITLAICCLLSLLWQFSVFKAGSLNKENEILEQILYREQKQHELSEETINIINIKCHDLKHQISLLRQSLDEDSSEEILKDVERAVLFYDSQVSTGNKNLDIVINEEKLFCDANKIMLDVMADGQQIDFMSPSDIYSLFGNALRNAVESVMCEEETYRAISLGIRESGMYVSISVSNYCTRPIDFSNGTVLTNKEDKKYHGFGLRSMRYIVEKYGGNMVFDLRDKTFTVKIIIKKPS